METHHINLGERTVNVGFHSGTDKARHLFSQSEHHHEFKRHMEDATKHGRTHFSVDGHYFKLSMHGHGAEMMPIIETSHALH